MSQYSEEIERRRTFAIISHPDAGKTTLTEKLLLFGGAIHVAGAVKSNKIKKTATSDWMEIEKQRGISVATSVMAFDYSDHKINILDTPGHQDFAEDTFRTLTAVDSVIIVIDIAKGVEAQTRKLMEVCRMRKTPVIVFVNKMDRDGKDPFDLLDEIEEELQIKVRPLSWPIDMGQRFRGVYNIFEQKLNLYTPSKQYVTENVEFKDITSPDLETYIDPTQAAKLREDIELIEGVYPEFDVNTYLDGDIAPVFFGSALNNFGVKELLDCFIRIAPSPRPIHAVERVVDPNEDNFTGFIFKIHANMDPNHRSCESHKGICTASELISPTFRAVNYEVPEAVCDELSNTQYMEFERDFLRFMLSDGAAALLLSDRPNEAGLSLKIEWVKTKSYANETSTCMRMGGELLPNGELKGWKEFGDRLNIGNFLLCQDFKILMNGMKYWVDFIEECIQEYAVDVHEIKTVIPHISSAFIGDELKKEMQSRNVELWDNWFTNLSEVGNIGSASIFVALDEYMATRAQKGEKILLLVPESARFSYGAALLTVV